MDPVTAAVLGTLLGGLAVAGLIAAAKKSRHAMAVAKRFFLGRDLRIIGHSKAGKTSLLNYLRYNRLADEHPTGRTRRISKRLSFDVDKGGELKLPVSRIFDIPGVLPPDAQVRLLQERPPQGIVVMLSACRNDHDDWLRSFLQHLAVFLATDPKLAHRLRSLVVVLNQTDRFPSDEECRAALSRLKATTVEELSDSLGSRTAHLVDVIPCTLLRSAGGEKAANFLVLTVLESLRAARRLVP